MHDILLPFLYLKSPEFPLSHVYAYFKGFIKAFMPNTIHPTKRDDSDQIILPHLKVQLNLLMLLLKYHDMEIYMHLVNFEIEAECFATSWILTNFTRVVQFQLIYLLLEIIMHEKDHLLIIFMSVALMKMFRQQILETESMEDCILALKRKLKIKDLKNLSQVYYEAVGIRSTTPSSFETLVNKLHLFDQSKDTTFKEDQINQIFEKDSID